MIRYILRTKNRQGEYLKPKYDGLNPVFWNHYIHSSRKKVEQYALKNRISGFIDRISV